jgi:hypothetical protein
MPLTFGVPLGLLVAVVGAVLFFATGLKRVAKVIIGFGLAITMLTVVLVALALSSNM